MKMHNAESRSQRKVMKLETATLLKFTQLILTYWILADTPCVLTPPLQDCNSVELARCWDFAMEYEKHAVMLNHVQACVYVCACVYV